MSKLFARKVRRFSAAVAMALGLVSLVSTSILLTSPTAADSVAHSGSASGYWLVAADGGIFTYGDAAFHGSPGGTPLNKPIVGMAATPDGGGYWLVAADGGIFTYGDAAFHGSPGGTPLNKPIVGMAATPDGGGYWLVAADGGIFTYGDAAFHGSPGGTPLNKPIVGMAATPDGGGYWLVAADGGIFTYGDAAFHGSPGGTPLNKPIVGMAATPDGGGYWLVAADGGIFTYGDAAFHGSPGGTPLNKPIVGMAATPDGGGYWLVAADGGIFTYGDAAFHGSPGGTPLNKPIVGMAALSEPTPHAASQIPTLAATGISPPAGYGSSQLIFQDNFTGTSLDTSKWVTYLGSSGAVWDNNGALPSPYSGPTLPGAGNESAMFAPSQVAVDNGLTLTAQRNSNQYATDYPWISGVVTTEGKFSLPTTGWYVQVKAKMPDQSQGMWPAIWFLPGVPGTPFNEIDGYEGGLLGPGQPNTLMNSNYFADQGQQDQLTPLGFDTTAGYHVYGVRFLPGQSITWYVDGSPVYQLLASSSVTITSEPYQIMLELQVATAQTAGWHTTTNSATPSSTMSVAEVQAYSAP